MYKPINKFRFYTHLVLPLTYSDALSYMEDIGGVVTKLNDVINSYNELIKYYNSLGDITQEINDKIAELDKTISETKEMVESTIDELTKQINEAEEALNQRVDTLVVETTKRIEALEEQLTTTITKQMETINQEIIILKSDFANLETSIGGKVDDILKDFIAELPDVQNVLVKNPLTGELVTIQWMIDWLIEYQRCEALTAYEYDMLGLTAEEYDNFFILGWGHGLTAYQYDWYGKTILGKIRHRRHWDAITGKQVYLDNKVDDNTDLIKASGSYTAGEYDALQMTAEEYDSRELTAYDYDWHSNQMLVPEENEEEEENNG